MNSHHLSSVNLEILQSRVTGEYLLFIYFHVGGLLHGGGEAVSGQGQEQKEGESWRVFIITPSNENIFYTIKIYEIILKLALVVQ